MKKKLKKTLASFIIISFLIFLPIQIVYSAGAVVYILKEFGLDLIARVLARTFLSTLMNNATEIISTAGRIPGTPTFVQDWRTFLEEAQYRGEDTTRAIIGGATAPEGTICQYLKNSLASAFGASKVDGFQPFRYRVDSLQYYSERNKCTLPIGFNVNTFRNDFSAGGGWAAWDKLIQPQNNFFGVYADSLDELARQRSFEEKTDQSEAGPSGFTSTRSACVLGGGNTPCLVLGQVLTPGQILKDTAAHLNLSELDWMTDSDELSEVLYDVGYNIGLAFNARLLDFATSKITGSIEADTSQGDALCVRAGEGPCYEKAKKWDCNASATGGSGGSSGGSGGSASTDCEQTIDQGIFDACMAEVRASCGIR